MCGRGSPDEETIVRATSGTPARPEPHQHPSISSPSHTLDESRLLIESRRRDADNTNRSAPSELMKVTDQRLKGKVIAQYAAVCVRPNPGAENDIQVLLITSRGSRRCVIPKGCRIPRKKPHEVARQEAWEEAGVRGQVKKKPVGALHLCQETEVTRSSARPRPGSLAKCLGARTRLSGGGAT